MNRERNDGAGELKGKALSVAGLAEYQRGAVVSRTLVDRKIGTVTVFAFDEGQGLSEHTAPFDAFVQIVDGEAEITISGVPMTARAGEFVIMPAGEPPVITTLASVGSGRWLTVSRISTNRVLAGGRLIASCSMTASPPAASAAPKAVA